MITAVSWIPKGNLKPISDVSEPLSKEELKELIESGAFERSVESSNDDEEEEIVEDEIQISEVDHAKAVAEAFGKSPQSKIGSSSMEVDKVDEGLKELDMDNYDEEDDEIELFSSGLGDLYYPSNKMDPYLKDVDDEDDEEEIYDKTIKPTDSVIICARNEDNINHLDVYVYDELSCPPKINFLHEILIQDFPLCTAYTDCPLKGGEKGNFVAVGTKESPTIGIWDLDVREEVVPPWIQLGGRQEEKIEGSHTDSVLGLAWNQEFRNVLASASADKKVKVWDVATGTCRTTMEHHTNKVQEVAWNHYAPQVLLSGSFDQTVVLKDVRQPAQSGLKWSVMSDVESLAWDPHTEHSFVVGLEDGTVKGFDIRTAKSGSESDLRPSFTIQTHEGRPRTEIGVSSISYNISAPNLLATGSMDKMVKLWDLTNNEPSCITTHIPKAGAVFSISFGVDNPFLLAIGGSMGKLRIWDTLSDANVSQKYGSDRS